MDLKSFSIQITFSPILLLVSFYFMGQRQVFEILLIENIGILVDEAGERELESSFLLSTSI